MITAEEIIELFNMKPLPQEGGYYTETYRTPESLPQTVLPNRYTGDRSFGTAILYFLTPSTFSILHRLKGDEIFHFYLGDAVTMLQLRPDGSSKVITLGKDIINDQRIQAVVPAETWQGMCLNDGGKFALLGTTMTPGFEYEDLELAQREKLLHQFPEHQALIAKLTHPD
jgi:predicted cupin superfamily sugar epimerase